MGPGPFLERLHEVVINAAYQKISHNTLHSLIAMLSVFFDVAAAAGIIPDS